jgi:hypothetical protein
VIGRKKIKSAVAMRDSGEIIAKNIREYTKRSAEIPRVKAI